MKVMNVSIIAALLCLGVLCSAVSATSLFVDPSNILLGKGESAQLVVRADDVEELGGYYITITWSPSLVLLTDVTSGPSFIMEKNIESGNVRIAGVNATGISGSTDLCYLFFTGLDDSGETSPVTILVNKSGFLNTGAEGILVDEITNGSITTKAQTPTTELPEHSLYAGDTAVSIDYLIYHPNDAQTVVNQIIYQQSLSMADLWYRINDGSVLSIMDSQPASEEEIQVIQATLYTYIDKDGVAQEL